MQNSRSDSTRTRQDTTLRYDRRSVVYDSRRRYSAQTHKDIADITDTRAIQPLPVIKQTPAKQSYTPAIKTSMQDIRPVSVRQQPQSVIPVKKESIQTPQRTQAANESILQEQPQTKRRLFSKPNILMAMAVSVFLIGVGISVNSLLTDKRVTQQAAVLGTNTGDGGGEGTAGDQKPDESHVDDRSVASYSVAPELPRRISIEKIDVNARIKPLGVNKENQLLAPANIYDAGWYNASAKPGVDAGAVLIDGHVHGPTKPGIFFNLKKLVAGDMIEVERGDGKKVKYRVEKTQKLPAGQVNMAALLTSVKPGIQGLNLITCGGVVDKKTGHYEDREMVFAVQVN